MAGCAADRRGPHRAARSEGGPHYAVRSPRSRRGEQVADDSHRGDIVVGRRPARRRRWSSGGVAGRFRRVARGAGPGRREHAIRRARQPHEAAERIGVQSVRRRGRQRATELDDCVRLRDRRARFRRRCGIARRARSTRWRGRWRRRSRAGGRCGLRVRAANGVRAPGLGDRVLHGFRPRTVSLCFLERAPERNGRDGHGGRVVSVER